MSPTASDLTVCLRFALLGIGASHFVLRKATPIEREGLVRELRYFGTMIREHLECERVSPISHTMSEDCPRRAQAIYTHLFDRYIALSHMNGPLDLVMSILVEEFVHIHAPELGKKFLVFKNRALERDFDLEAQRSLRFALNFAERRKHDLEELPEIALIGE